MMIARRCEEHKCGWRFSAVRVSLRTALQSMKIFFSESVTGAAPASWLARIGHEALSLAVVGIFCAFELLVRIAEFRPGKYFSRSRAAGRIPRETKLGTGSRRDCLCGK
jgi:hypothetical protein